MKALQKYFMGLFIFSLANISPSSLSVAQKDSYELQVVSLCDCIFFGVH